MSKGIFTQRDRRTCYQRAGGRCEICGRWLPAKGWNLHHRKPRGMGGTSRKVTPADGLVVCGSGTTGCHLLIESNRAWSLGHGYLLPNNKLHNPTEVPVFRFEREWVLLNTDGSATPYSGSEQAIDDGFVIHSRGGI